MRPQQVIVLYRRPSADRSVMVSASGKSSGTRGLAVLDQGAEKLAELRANTEEDQ